MANLHENCRACARQHHSGHRIGENQPASDPCKHAGDHQLAHSTDRCVAESTQRSVCLHVHVHVVEWFAHFFSICFLSMQYLCTRLQRFRFLATVQSPFGISTPLNSCPLRALPCGPLRFQVCSFFFDSVFGYLLSLIGFYRLFYDSRHWLLGAKRHDLLQCVCAICIFRSS